MFRIRPTRALFAAALLAISAALFGCVDAPTEHRLRANAFLRGGDAASAVKECDLGLERKKDDVALLILRGKALFELDRMDDAKASYAHAVSAGKDLGDAALTEAHLGLAMIAFRQKDFPEARKRFEALTQVNPKDATSQLNVARVCLELRDMECAVSHAEAAGRLRGNDESVLYTLGSVYLAAGKPKEAELTFEHICETVPGASSCPYGIAMVAAKSGDKARALAKLKEAVSRKVPNPHQIATEPSFASIKDDPEFAAIVAQANAPQPPAP
jgi:tetratricopeptide (TPR) repeat protein